ncbi:hypothetical protein GGE35_002963 [Rhizobium cellulosilyticum]|uniref:Uncharacterized protein n=1 Tax=Aliirhizobium cellulosilyticum TaxID=393664 RepID=A0A7W6Y2I8_9HYPH|nr:hypothetical protein [Rhizobium cellulosilyticum]MBB4447141.1 hypothetical protein [Rhizobium cellulosilyticum]
MSLPNYRAPNGKRIVGTAETVLATAWISYIDPETADPEYDGGTKVYWDTQETLTRDGKVLLVCSDGQEWTFDQLISVEPLDA